MEKKGGGLPYPAPLIIKRLLMAKLPVFLVCLFSMQTFAHKGLSQINLDLKNASYKKVFSALEKQTSFHFVYNDDVLPDNKITLAFQNATLKDVMRRVLDNTALTYKVIDQNLVVISSGGVINALPVKGRVSGPKNEPLVNVSVQEKGKNNGTFTKDGGGYSITVTDANAVLVFSSVGYVTKEVPVNGQSVVNVTLEEDERKTLSDVVVIGYGSIKKTDLTGAVVSVRADDLKTAGVNSVDKALQGKMAGVDVESAGGDPGSGMRILIRGVGTINNTDPLYVVDGVQVSSISNIAPSDIADISVLKDASAAAIYGSRAANGVVIVTTKSGSSGKVAVRFNAYYGVQNVAKTMDVLNAQQWATVSNAAHAAAGLSGLDIAKDPAALGAGTDWQKAIYRTAPVQNYELNVSGGSQGSVYSVSGGYLNQKGIVDKSGYTRYNLRVKSETTKGRFKIGETVLLSQESWNSLPGAWGGQGGNPVGGAAKMISAFSIYDSTAVGGYGGAYGPVVNIANPVAQLNLEQVKSDATKVLIDAYGQVDLVKGLNYKLNIGYTNNAKHSNDYTQRYTVGALFTNPTNNLSESRDADRTILIENTLNFNRLFGKHSIQALAGYTYQDRKYDYLGASATGLPDGVKQLDAAQGTRSNSGNETENTLLSLLGRVVYSYDQRYMLQATFRRDASSRFAPDNRYGNYPSLGVGWNLSNEKFFEGLTKTINSLKIRGSYGVLGNQEFTDYQYLAAIASNINYVTGTGQTRWVGAIQQALASPNIKWESSKTVNAGLDMALLSNRLLVSIDYFNKKTTDMLVQVPIPGSVGSSSNPYVNAGSITNHGVELGIRYSGNAGKLTYNINGTFSTSKNKVIALGSGSQQIIGGQPTLHNSGTTTTQVGGEVGAFYLIKTAGIFNSQAEIDAYKGKDGTLIQPNAHPGDIKFVDYNNDGAISDLDKQYCGSPNPKFTYGIGGNVAWKGFDLNVFFQGTHGNKIYNGFRMDLDGMDREMNYSVATLNAWTADHHTNFPRAVIDDPNLNARVSDRFLESGSYFRCKTLQVGYSFSPRMLEKATITSLRVYASCDNLFTVTKYTGFNPDLGRTGSILDRGVDYSYVNYPLARTITFGLQLAF